MTSILDRIKAANHAERISKANVRKGQTTAQMPVLKRIANGTIIPKRRALEKFLNEDGSSKRTA